MRLTAVHLRHFRNLNTLDWTPAPGLNLIHGRNGQGKTNLLEAVHVALTGRSFRTRRDEDLTPWNWTPDAADPTLCEATVRRASGARRLRLLLGRGWKRAFADSQWLPRLGMLLGEASVVVFTPDDAGLFQGPPGARRRLLDMVLSQLSPEYLLNLQQHTQAQKQLTAAYRLRGSDEQAREAAQAYAPLVARTGAALMAARAARLTAARVPLENRYATLGGSGCLELGYDPGLRRLPEPMIDQAATQTPAAVEALTAFYARELDRTFEEARRLGSCPSGAHRDDFALRLDGQDLRRFGSQGQHRLSALTLKLETADWIRRALDETPILLLDDFGSELDRPRRLAVLESLRPAMQVIVTATEVGDLGPPDLFDGAARIDSGQLRVE
jgi:DNA replication and repair protein RecF